MAKKEETYKSICSTKKWIFQEKIEGNIVNSIDMANVVVAVVVIIINEFPALC